MGYPQVDLMATSNSKKVLFYYSALLDDEALGIDAFTKNWDQFSISYIFPPPPMAELVLNRIYQGSQDSRFILITRWFPKALKYVCFLDT